MAGAVYVHEGHSIDYTPETDLVAGDVVILGELAGVTKRDIPAGTLGALAVAGIFDFPKAADVAIDAGVDVFWDSANSVASVDSGAGTGLGRSVAAAADADATVRVRLSQ